PIQGPRNPTLQPRGAGCASNRADADHRLVEPPLNPAGSPSRRTLGRRCAALRLGGPELPERSKWAARWVRAITYRSWLVLKGGCGDNQRELRKHLPAQAFAPVPLPLNFPSIKKSQAVSDLGFTPGVRGHEKEWRINPMHRLLRKRSEPRGISSARRG